MGILKTGLVILSLYCGLLLSCSKQQEVELTTRLLITVVDDSSKSGSGATVRLYKNAQDPGITQITDTAGIVIFRNLETDLYYWLAEKGCKTNRNSQTTLSRPLIKDLILYGRSVLSETGILKITNASTEPYKVHNSRFDTTLANNTTFIAYPKTGPDTIHYEKIGSAGISKDTIIQLRCGDTTTIILPR